MNKNVNKLIKQNGKGVSEKFYILANPTTNQ